MTTRYPTDLFPVPAERWDFTIDHVEGIATKVNEMNKPVIFCRLDADNAGQAERRALSVLHHDYEDQLDDAEATATQAGGEWFVTVMLRPYL